MIRGDSTPSFTFGGRHLALLMAGFFGVVIAVNGLLAVLAGGSWTGLVVQNAYVASQHHNEELEDARRQDALGWRSEIRAEPDRIVLVLRDRRDSPVSGIPFDLRLSRATHEGEDRRLRLDERAPGTYTADAALARGLWLAELRTTAESPVSYRRDYRIVVGTER